MLTEQQREIFHMSAQQARRAIGIMQRLKGEVYTNPKSVEEYLRGAWTIHMEDYVELVLHYMNNRKVTRCGQLTSFVVLNAYILYSGDWDKMIEQTELMIARIERKI